jgi:hypothetical protein
MPDRFGQAFPNPATSILNPRAIFKGASIRSLSGLISVTTSEIIGDRLWIGRISSSAIILPQSLITHAALGAGVTMNVGFSGAGQAALLASALAVATAGTKSPIAAVTTPNLKNRVWQLAGLTSDPGGELEMIATIAGANVTSAGTVDFSILIAEDR